VGVRKAARIVSEDVTVLRVNVEVDNARALLLDVNVIQMFVGIVGLVVEMALWAVHHREVITMNAEI